MQDHPSSRGVYQPRARPLRAYAVMDTMRAIEHLAFGPLSSSELATRLQIGPTKARRMLQRLAVEGYARQQGGHRRRYKATLQLAAVGRQLLEHSELPHVAAPTVARIAAVTSCHARLWIPAGTDVVCILEARAHLRPPTPTPILGELRPATEIAAGIALLAHRARWQTSILAPLTLPDRHKLETQLKQVQTAGHATAPMTSSRAPGGAAATVFEDQEAVAAIEVIAQDEPAEATQYMIEQVIAAAATISQHLKMA